MRWRRNLFEELKAGLRKVGSQLAEPEIKMLMEVVNFYNCISFIIDNVITSNNISSLIITMFMT